ncbi:hypothetical protein R3P38DRAFT_3505860 [Favolaschia claudopus]|uniref:Uncharacterized protein n=1 Tax=Favolaschia claudopus TaxID=2862362 RepID=A0AAV9Z255_9AGAR
MWTQHNVHITDFSTGLLRCGDEADVARSGGVVRRLLGRRLVNGSSTLILVFGGGMKYGASYGFVRGRGTGSLLVFSVLLDFLTGLVHRAGLLTGLGLRGTGLCGNGGGDATSSVSLLLRLLPWCKTGHETVRMITVGLWQLATPDPCLISGLSASTFNLSEYLLGSLKLVIFLIIPYLLPISFTRFHRIRIRDISTIPDELIWLVSFDLSIYTQISYLCGVRAFSSRLRFKLRRHSHPVYFTLTPSFASSRSRFNLKAQVVFASFTLTIQV